jgi:hypothetical protein
LRDLSKRSVHGLLEWFQLNEKEWKVAKKKKRRHPVHSRDPRLKVLEEILASGSWGPNIKINYS